MMEIRNNLGIILEKIIRIKPGQTLLVIADSYARSKAIADATLEVATAMGVPTVLAVMAPRTRSGHEPHHP